MIAACASDVIHSTALGLQTQHPSAFRRINRDSNHICFSKTLTNFTQTVCEMQKKETKILDLLYANVKEAILEVHIHNKLNWME